MKPPFKLSDLKNSKVWHLNPHLEEVPKEKKAKYRNVITEVDGIKFRSAKEAGRYMRLKLLRDAKLITDLRLQVPYELNPGGTHSLKYYADFVYKENGVEIVEDVKGCRTELYKKKAKLMLEVHGITIKEV